MEDTNMFVPEEMKKYFETLIDQAANSKVWKADQAKEEFKQSLRKPLETKRCLERGATGVTIIKERIGSYPNDRLCMKEFDQAMDKLTKNPDLLKADKQTSTTEFKLPESVASQLNISEETEAVFHDIGMKLFEENKNEEAICVFTLLSGINAVNHKVWMNLGVSHLRAKEWLPALKAFTAASLLTPENPLPYLCNIESYLALHNKEGAEEALRKVQNLVTDENKQQLTPALKHYERLIAQQS